MKRHLRTLLIALLCLMIPTSALAYITAIPNQKLAFRTGPGTKYVELYTMPQSTDLTAIEYEEGNGVTWVLVEFWKDGGWVRAYTGLKRMSVQGELQWADHLNISAYADYNENVISGPGPMYAPRGEINPGDVVTILRYEYDYAYIEFYDAEGTPSRGYVSTDVLVENDQDDAPTFDNSFWNYNAVGTPITLPGNVIAGIPLMVCCDYSTPLLESVDPGSRAQERLLNGTIVTGYGYTNTGYAFVEYNGILGYVDRSCLCLN